MAKITLKDIRHSYIPRPQSEEDYALKYVDLDWQEGGAYALLGPSGCGKTTLLNIISGLVNPSEGELLFDDRNVTDLPPDARNIAQVFQFPVIYDTMTVYDNLAFPLRNRSVKEVQVAKRVKEIAAMLELDRLLQQKAAGLSPDNKQKISLGRGLVRDDVNVIMFDEPLTVIDPHLKWKLRSKLKELHQKVRRTMIYVTHDQTEALSFAEHVVVMQFGQILQVGAPIDLFERPAHTFVGHFIGSPGMNILPCEVTNGEVLLGSHRVGVANNAHAVKSASVEIGVRPEFVRFASEGIAARVTNVLDVGRHKVAETAIGEHKVNVILKEGPAAGPAAGPASGQAASHAVPGDTVCLEFDAKQTRLYEDGWLVQEN